MKPLFSRAVRTVTDATDAAIFAADHGEPLQREGRLGTVSQQVLERLTIDTQLKTKERDPHASPDELPAIDIHSL